MEIVAIDERFAHSVQFVKRNVRAQRDDFIHWPCKISTMARKSKNQDPKRRGSDIDVIGKEPILPNNLRRLRNALGLSQEAVGEKIGTTKGFVSEMERLEKAISNTNLIRFAALFGCEPSDIYDMSYQSQNRDHTANVVHFTDSLKSGKRLQKIPLQRVGVTHIVPVLGKVEAGAWREMEDLYDFEDVVECELPEYQGVELHAHNVEGTSVNKFIEPGGKAVWVALEDVINGLQQGDYVIAMRPNGAGQFERTVKQLVVLDDGTYELWPRSTDPQHQTPYIIPPRDEHSQEGVTIVGVVVDRRQPKIVRSNIQVPPNRVMS